MREDRRRAGGTPRCATRLNTSIDDLELGAAAAPGIELPGGRASATLPGLRALAVRSPRIAIDRATRNRHDAAVAP